MRLTLPLYKFSMRHAIKEVYKRRAYVRPSPEKKQWYLEDKIVVDPVKLPDYTTGLYVPKEELGQEKPVPKELIFDKQPKLEESSNYHENFVYEYHYNTRLMEGLRQACILTKTEPIFELPQRIVDSIGKVEIPDQDELVQRCIMQANVWDPTKDKLPRRLNKMLPGWKFKAEYGIPQNKIRTILMQNLIRLCHTIDGEYPDLLHTRALIESPYVSVSYTLYGDKPIIIRGVEDWLMTSIDPLKPWADAERVDATTLHKLPDLTPISPTIDLLHQHVYKENENSTGYTTGFQFSNPHTMFTTTVENRSIDEHQAKLLMFCFANTLATAIAKYGHDTRVLPEPITIQCISTDSVRFNFTCFQLNTLDMTSSGGVKNLIWFDSDQPMYNKIVPRRAMLRNTRYEDYNPDVFKKMLAFYIQGANLNKVKEHIEARL